MGGRWLVLGIIVICEACASIQGPSGRNGMYDEGSAGNNAPVSYDLPAGISPGENAVLHHYDDLERGTIGEVYDTDNELQGH